VNGYEISTDSARLDVDYVHAFLTTSYWSPGVPRDTVARAIAGSLCFGLYAPDGAQCGFARVVTDRATYAWLADVFVDPAHRGHGLGVRLVETVLAHPELQGLRRWALATRDAHGLYERFGFTPLPDPSSHMIRRPPSADASG
jgi:GNAT superfamily N-acetyltransferase